MTFQGLGLSFSDRSLPQAEDVMKLLNICLKTMHFQFEDKFSHKKYGMEVGSSLLPVVSCVFMEHFRE
jgi:hypothetical protein